jgi:murein L,D-transpeptidase YcbB/YkuD
LGVSPDTADPDAYDDSLVAAVRQFQATHGLNADGIVGRATLVALNVPAADRIRAMELNLERWRWLPRHLGESYVMVNTAAFAVELVNRDHAVQTMRAIVGRPDWPTPIVSARITELVLSPTWEIPKPIALAEVLPLVRRDPRYLAREHITVSRDSDGVMRDVDPLTVDWAAITDSTFGLSLTQAPGGHNPLGGIKFVFRNRFGVRIHDTPTPSLFAEQIRTFSHGCIRVEHAAELAAALLQDSRRWPLDSVRARMHQPHPETVPLPRATPVHVSYWTVWVDHDGTVEFRDDVYGWDSRLSAALAARAPVPTPRPGS